MTLLYRLPMKSEFVYGGERFIKLDMEVKMGRHFIVYSCLRRKLFRLPYMTQVESYEYNQEEIEVINHGTGRLLSRYKSLDAPTQTRYKAALLRLRGQEELDQFLTKVK